MQKLSTLLVAFSFLTFSLSGHAADPNESFIKEYKFWAIPGSITVALLLAPQGLSILYSQALEGEFLSAFNNATATSIAENTFIATVANAVSVADAIPLLFVTLRHLDSTTNGCSGLRVARHAIEGIFAATTLVSTGFQVCAAGEVINLFSEPVQVTGSPASLMPAMVTITVSAVVGLFASISGVALIIVSFKFKSSQYQEIT